MHIYGGEFGKKYTQNVLSDPLDGRITGDLKEETKREEAKFIV